MKAASFEAGRDTGLMAHRFSRIYIERGVEDHTITRTIVSRLPWARKIPVNHYKDMFSRPGQDRFTQKSCPQLILAAGRPPFLYRGAEVCPSFGNPAFYYASSIMNCIYDCEYCYLQGMYSSANIVVFVTIEDIFSEIDSLLKTLRQKNSAHTPTLYLCNSYDTDLLALDRIVPLSGHWLDFASRRPEMLMEMRTKSAGTAWITRTRPVPNAIIAWTMTPDPVARTFEPHAPPLSARLKAAQRAISAGWRVRLCIDPMLFVKDWDIHYSRLIDDIFRRLDPEQVDSVSIGVFRMGKDLLKRARKARPDSGLLYYPFENIRGVCSYPPEISSAMTTLAEERLRQFMPGDKITIQDMDPTN